MRCAVLFRIWLVLVTGSLGAASPAGATQTMAGHPSFAFGGTELQRNRFSIFPKWAGMLARQAATVEPAAVGGPALPGGGPGGSGDCVPNPKFSCLSGVDSYKSFVDSVRPLPRDDQLKTVNRFLNASPYITDPVNWGVTDYWETLREFLTRDGDCEDYAISKYMTLKSLGWDSADMRVIVVQDENLQVAHAILAVKYNGKTYILDNQIQNILPETAIRHYRPFYSLNDSGFWVHSRP
jgi:predicted transglutaminase-like cysteine proteinase